MVTVNSIVKVANENFMKARLQIFKFWRVNTKIYVENPTQKFNPFKEVHRMR